MIRDKQVEWLRESGFFPEERLASVKKETCGLKGILDTREAQQKKKSLEVTHEN